MELETGLHAGYKAILLYLYQLFIYPRTKIQNNKGNTMNKPQNRKTLIDEVNLPGLQKEILDMRSQIQTAIDEDPQYSGELDLLMCVIDNLNSEIDGVKSADKLDAHQQARVLADMALFHAMISQMFEEEMDVEAEDEEEFDFDEFDAEEEDEENDSRRR